MQIFNLETLVNTSYILMFVSFLMRDILLLRVIYSLATVLLVFYFLLKADGLWSVIFWNSVFLLINLGWVVKILYDRRPVLFSEEQQQLWKSVLHRMKPKHARVLFRMGDYKTMPEGTLIVEEGKTLDYLALVVDGEAELQIGATAVERIGEGHFIGSAMLLESRATFRSKTTIRATKQSRLLIWSRQDLIDVIERDDDFSIAFEATLGLDIAHLLGRAWLRQANPV